MLPTVVRRDGRNLTARQIATLMTVYRGFRAHYVSSLAELLNVWCPAVPRIIARLVGFELVERQAGSRDRRRVLIRHTARGGKFLDALAAIARSSLPGP